MIKLRYKLPHSDGTEQTEFPLEIDGDSATIGRDKGCEIRIQQPYVSKRHARILRGIVVIDLGSSNGTFVAGERLHEAALVRDGRIVLGKDDVIIDVELEEPLPEPEATLPRAAEPARASPPSLSSAEKARLEAEVERFRSRSVLLEMDLERLKRELDSASQSTAAVSQVDELRAENQRLEQRLASLKHDIEAREHDDAQSVQARLMSEELARMRARSEELERRLAVADQVAAQRTTNEELDRLRTELEELRARVREQAQELTRSRAEGERARRAEQDLQVQTDAARRLREELEALRQAKATPPAQSAPPAGASPAVGEMLRKFGEQNAALQRRVNELEERGAGRGPGSAASAELFAKLQAENAELKKRLAAQPVASYEPARPSASDARAALRVTELERLNHELQREVERLAAERSRPAVPVPVQRTSAASNGRMVALLGELADHDAGEKTATLALAVDEFVVSEVFRCLRNVEKVVTRMAGEFIQIYDARTIMPGTDGSNLRLRLSGLLAAPRDEHARAEIVEYFDLMGRWLAASVLAHQRAAVRFAEELKRELTQEALSQKKERPRIVYSELRTHAQLWLSANKHLRELSSEIVQGRLEKIAREEAERLVHPAG